MVRYLLGQGADATMVDISLLTCLHHAALAANNDCIAHLMCHHLFVAVPRTADVSSDHFWQESVGSKGVSALRVPLKDKTVLDARGKWTR